MKKHITFKKASVIFLSTLLCGAVFADYKTRFEFVCSNKSTAVCVIGTDRLVATDKGYALDAVGAKEHAKLYLHINAVSYKDYNAARTAAKIGIGTGAIAVIGGAAAAGGVAGAGLAISAIGGAAAGAKYATADEAPAVTNALKKVSPGVVPSYTVGGRVGGVYLADPKTLKATTNLDISCQRVFRKRKLKNGNRYEIYLLPHGRVLSVTVTSTPQGYKNCAMFD